MEAMEAAETQPAAVAAEQELQEQVQAVITEEPEETGFNMQYQELTLITPAAAVAAVARTAAPAVQVAPAAAAMAEITEEEAEEVMEQLIQAAAAAERGHMLENRALTAAQAL
jgi:hypothetical protein